MKEIVDNVLLEVYGSWRFRWWALLTAWIVAVLGWLLISVLPNVYEAGARVYVNTTSTLRPLIEDITVSPDLTSQLDQVRLVMLGRPALQKVASATELDLNVRSEEDLEDLLFGLQRDITIKGGEKDRRGKVNNVYTILFEHEDRKKAVEVVDTLLRTFVEDSLGASRSGSENAQRFLEDEIRKAEARLATAETALAEFRRENQGLMPDEQGTFFNRLQSQQTQLEATLRERKLALSRRGQIIRQLNSEEPLLPGTGSGEKAPAGSLEARIQENDAELENLLLRFTEKHPKVIALRETLSDLKEKRREQLAQLGVKNSGASLTALDSNPIYQSLRVALSEVDIDLARLNVVIDDHRTRIAELTATRDQAPDVEAQLSRLNRDYDIVKNQYEELTRRLEMAKLSEEAGRNDEVDFRIIDPPTAAFEPVKPDRVLFVLGSLGAGLLAGAGLAFLMHQLQPVFNTGESLRQFAGLPVIGTVGITFRDRFNDQAKRKLYKFSAAAIALVALCGVTLGLTYAGVFPL